jgi:hypothetical protein
MNIMSRIRRFTQSHSHTKELLMFKLLPILFLFTGFQASAVLIGNLTYDGTYISGDGRTYVGLDTIASWDYLTTFNATQADGVYEDFRIANNADADYFIGSLFGAQADTCSTVDGTPANTFCGIVPGWFDGIFGDNFNTRFDSIWFTADVDALYDVGFVEIAAGGRMWQYEFGEPYAGSNEYSANGSESHTPIAWLLVKDTVVSANEPSILALMALGIFGFGFARRRR